MAKFSRALENKALMGMTSPNSVQSLWTLRDPKFPLSSSSSYSYFFHSSSQAKLAAETNRVNFGDKRTRGISEKRARVVVRAGTLLPGDPWAPSVDSQSIASQLFALSLFPYLGFLYYISKSKSAPKITLFGFYFLLVFVGATIPAGIYAKVHYGTSLSNVDWLHGGAESFLTLSNLFVVLGLREALRKANDVQETSSNLGSDTEKETSSS